MPARVQWRAWLGRFTAVTWGVMTEQRSETDLPDVVARAADGEAAAWRELVAAYTPRVYGLLLSRCRDPELAEELTQDTFARIAARLSGEGYDERGRFEPWLFRIAMNRLRDDARRKKRQAGTMDMTGSSDGEAAHAWAGAEATARRPGGQPLDGDDPHDAAETREAVDLLKQAIATMSDKDREILHLRHTAGLSFPEIARALGEPQGTVLARGHRALQKLRKLLAGRGVTQL